MKMSDFLWKSTEGFQSSCPTPAAKEVIDLNGAKSSQIGRPPESQRWKFIRNLANPRKIIPVTLLIISSCDLFLFTLFDTMVAFFAFVWSWLMCLRDYYLCIRVIVMCLYNFAICVCVALPPVFWFLLLPNSGKRPFLPFPSQITTKDDIPFLKRWYLPNILKNELFAKWKGWYAPMQNRCNYNP